MLAMTEGGAMYQRLVNVPLWQENMHLMKNFMRVGRYFFMFTPPVLLAWLAVVLSGWSYRGPYWRLLRWNHVFYLLIIVSTAAYFIPFLADYVGNESAVITGEGNEALQTWATWSMMRQIVGFVVITNYAYLLSVVPCKA